ARVQQRPSVHEGATCPTRPAQRGLTPIELLTGVVNARTLAALPLASPRHHLSRARSAAALHIVQGLRPAQEHWLSEHTMYLDVSTDEAWYPRVPRVAPRAQQAFYYAPEDDTHRDGDEWLLLRPTAPGAVRYGYLVNAGVAGDPMTAPSAPGPAVTWPATTDSWYV